MIYLSFFYITYEKMIYKFIVIFQNFLTVFKKNLLHSLIIKKVPIILRERGTEPVKSALYPLERIN